MSHKEHGLNHSFTFTHKHYGDRSVITTLLTIHKIMCAEEEGFPTRISFHVEFGNSKTADTYSMKEIKHK